MVYNAICHTQLEVRREAADCLTALIHCGFQSLTSYYIEELFDRTNDKMLSKKHGAVLALSAVIRAFPFTIPPLVFEMIPKYCKLGINSDSLTRVSEHSLFSNTVTETLRSFLRTHHDKMIETGEKGFGFFCGNYGSSVKDELGIKEDCSRRVSKYRWMDRLRGILTCRWMGRAMKIIDKSDIIEEYERIKQAEQDQISLRQDVDSNNIRSADRIEDLLCFPIDAQKDLRKTDRIYMTDDNRRLLLIREYGDMRSSESMKFVFQYFNESKDFNA
uniref:DUF3437 domain-containing protein n=1 Tax=Elaeophora elaphi TaxID=1147741 RepID=A0A0R3S233_9BILA